MSAPRAAAVDADCATAATETPADARLDRRGCGGCALTLLTPAAVTAWRASLFEPPPDVGERREVSAGAARRVLAALDARALTVALDDRGAERVAGRPQATP